MGSKKDVRKFEVSVFPQIADRTLRMRIHEILSAVDGVTLNKNPLQTQADAGRGNAKPVTVYRGFVDKAQEATFAIDFLSVRSQITELLDGSEIQMNFTISA